MIDFEAVRKDFPIFEETEGHSLIYLDSAATTQRPSSVIEAVSRFYRENNANVHRGFYKLSTSATEAYEEARRKVANMLGVRSQEVIFTKSATEALNLLAYSLGEIKVGPGDEILVTEMEHHANLIPWQLLARRKEAQLVPVGITPEGKLDLQDLERKLSQRTRIVAVTHVSNVLGTINPIPHISTAAHKVKALVVVDAAQSVPHMPVKVSDLGADFVAFSGHKMLGPTGIGILWGKLELLDEMPPFLTGGEMMREVWIDHAIWNDVPYKFEAGTPPIAQAIGLSAAIEYLSGLGFTEVRRHEVELLSLTLKEFCKRDYIEVYGPKNPEERGGVIAFNLKGLYPHDVATLLDEKGIAIRAGHHCAQPLHRRLGIETSCRASFYVYNTAEEVKIFIAALDKIFSEYGR